jgi:hypothetical protein
MTTAQKNAYQNLLVRCIEDESVSIDLLREWSEDKSYKLNQDFIKEWQLEDFIQKLLQDKKKLI